MEKRVSARGEIESRRLACSFTDCVLDSRWVQNGCALHRAQGLGWTAETRSKKVCVCVGGVTCGLLAGMRTGYTSTDWTGVACQGGC